MDRKPSSGSSGPFPPPNSPLVFLNSAYGPVGVAASGGSTRNHDWLTQRIKRWSKPPLISNCAKSRVQPPMSTFLEEYRSRISAFITSRSPSMETCGCAFPSPLSEASKPPTPLSLRLSADPNQKSTISPSRGITTSFTSGSALWAWATSICSLPASPGAR